MPSRTSRSSGRRSRAGGRHHPELHEEAGRRRQPPTKPDDRPGRYTPPIAKSARKSPAWVGPSILVMLLLGLIAIMLNYFSILPGSPSGWWLVGGLGAIAIGILSLINWR